MLEHIKNDLKIFKDPKFDKNGFIKVDAWLLIDKRIL